MTTTAAQQVALDSALGSPAYKTYLAFTTGAVSPKKVRKFKKPVSPSRKSTLVTVEEEEPEPAKKKNTPAKAERSKEIDFLSDTALLEEARVKKVLRRSHRETPIHQAGGSGDGAGFQIEVPNKPKGKSVNTHEGTSLKPGVPDVSKSDSSESEYESWGDSGDEANVQGDDEDIQDSDDEPQQADDERTNYENQDTKDDEEESDDEFIHTPLNYVPTDDEKNDESNDVDKEEYDRIDKELYGDVNASLTDDEQDDVDEEDADMTDAAHVQVEQTQEQTTGVQEESVPKMASVQGQYVVQVTTTVTPAIQNATTESTETEVVSMLDINVQHEVPRTSQLLTIPISVIPEHTVFNPSEIVTTTPATTITLLLSSLFTNLQSETLNAIYLRLSDLEKEVKELKNVDHSSALLSKIKSEVLNVIKEYLGTSLDYALYKVLKKHDADIIKEFSVPAKIVERLTQQYLPQQSTEKSTEDIWKIKMEHASKQQVPKFIITSSDIATLEEYDQKTTLFNTMTKSKSFNKSHKHGALYHSLMESILEDEDVMDEGVTDKLKKKKLDDANQDEGPTSTKDHFEEPIFMQDFDYATHDDAEFDNTDMPMDQGEDLGNTDEQPNDEDVPKYDWYKKSRSDTSPDPKWNEGKLVDDGLEQSWLNDMAKATKPPLTIDKLMHTPIDFSAFVMNRLKIDNLTNEILVGPDYNLQKGTCKSYVELDYTMEE
ncbi:hypothetical protein Tco_1004211 [Tanacetum coccineum]|uniref:Uncharacterized protein n=1 Tax=Tanacetum coccineum TaxID=301880 RepID=A0ABQ5FCN6_9ASTR